MRGSYFLDITGEWRDPDQVQTAQETLKRAVDEEVASRPVCQFSVRENVNGNAVMHVRRGMETVGVPFVHALPALLPRIAGHIAVSRAVYGLPNRIIQENAMTKRRQPSHITAVFQGAEADPGALMADIASGERNLLIIQMTTEKAGEDNSVDIITGNALHVRNSLEQLLEWQYAYSDVSWDEREWQVR